MWVVELFLVVMVVRTVRQWKRMGVVAVIPHGCEGCEERFCVEGGGCWGG